LARVDSVVATDRELLASELDPLARWAPAVAPVLSRLMVGLWGASDAEVLALVRVRIAQLLRNDAELERSPVGMPQLSSERLSAVSQWPTSPLFSDAERACLGFTEQFIMDVSGVSEELRNSLGAQLGPAEFGAFVTSLYLLDYGQRLRMAVERLFPDAAMTWLEAAERDGTGDGTGAAGASVQADLDEFLKATALLHSIDMVTTEVVRLRGARRHNCRICQSTRSVVALEAGADEAMFDKIDHYERSDLVASHKVALRLVDAIISQPNEIDASLAAQVHSQFRPPQVIEILLDVMRNSCQKVAVALAVDDPHVTSGTELYALTEDGDVAYLA
jgi:alkylhydroperoxidase family enzyme